MHSSTAQLLLLARRFPHGMVEMYTVLSALFFQVGSIIVWLMVLLMNDVTVVCRDYIASYSYGS